MFLITNALINACADFVKPLEDLKLKPYFCSSGRLTIGWGHVVDKKLTPEQLRTGISEAFASELLQSDMRERISALQSNVKVKLNDNQIIALMSFVFNVGVGAFKDSTLLKKLNAGAKFEHVAEEFHRWVYREAKYPDEPLENRRERGLVNRRAKEAALFLTPVQSTQPQEIVIVKLPFFKKLFNFFAKMRNA